MIHQKTLTGARDRFGIKPLYYGFLGGRFVFSSELKSFGKLSDFNSEINQQSLWHYFSLQHIPGKDSIFSQIKRLPPANYFKYDLENKDLKISPYWCIPSRKETGRTIDAISEELRSRISMAVKRWSASDVDIGFALSGGIDSAIMVGLGAQFSPERIKTYAWGLILLMTRKSMSANLLWKYLGSGILSIGKSSLNLMIF